ncbi:hypothetical protein BWK60_01995 [Flavobacterium covae]|uniref:hypothetical protein n=1 Tax=Flavobacterium covae TaxID=2906076 RepID=UPI000B4CC2B6|nr:hypothetical protein [Flavobacterium covae]OWP87785.1 hypothetical protein BWK60_01995 [Flavobacterium covae]
MTAGRPLEDLSSLPDNWYVSVLELYQEGASDVEIKALISQWRGRFSNTLWERWMNEEEEFSETIKNGRLLAEAWWVRNGRVNLKDKDFSYTGWYMQMKNRFGWKDKTDITTDDKPVKSNTIAFIDLGEDD